MNTRFAVAVHILTILQSQGGEPVTSEFIASSVGTNPSLIRRLISHLSRAGLVRAQRGTGGGAVLDRPAESITLLDVYRAVDTDGDVIPIHRTWSIRCPIGRHIQAALESRFEAAERAMWEELARSTVADLARDVTGRESQPSARTGLR